MAASSEKSSGEKNKKFWQIKDLSQVNNAIFRYVPFVGCGSYLVFSSNIMNPRLFRSAFSPYELSVANSLWFNAHLGVGLYLYNCKHIRQAPTGYTKIMYSVFGTAVFNFGSVLMWATTKSLMPENSAVRVLFGLLSGVDMILMGKEYLAYVDSKCDDQV